MADFTAVLMKAVNNLSEASPTNRQKVYDKARNAVLRQLENMHPHPPGDMIRRQLNRLEESIIVVEKEARGVFDDDPFKDFVFPPVDNNPQPPSDNPWADLEELIGFNRAEKIEEAVAVTVAIEEPELAGGTLEVELLIFALKSQIQDHRDTLSRRKPNTRAGIESHHRQFDFLDFLMNKLTEIEGALRAIAGTPDEARNRASVAADVVGSVKTEMQSWWEKNKEEAVDWTFRFPAMAGFIALLNLAGATPVLATTAAIAGIGGPKLADAIRQHKEKS